MDACLVRINQYFCMELFILLNNLIFAHSFESCSMLILLRLVLCWSSLLILHCSHSTGITFPIHPSRSCLSSSLRFVYLYGSLASFLDDSLGDDGFPGSWSCWSFVASDVGHLIIGFCLFLKDFDCHRCWIFLLYLSLVFCFVNFMVMTLKFRWWYSTCTTTWFIV